MSGVDEAYSCNKRIPLKTPAGFGQVGVVTFPIILKGAGEEEEEKSASEWDENGERGVVL